MRELPGYIIAQLLGAIAGAAAVPVVILSSKLTGYDLAASGLGQNGWGEGYLNGYGLLGALVTEFVATFIFVYVILAGDEPDGEPPGGGSHHRADAVCPALPVHQRDGLSVNPARSLGPGRSVGGKALAQVWLFLVVPSLAGACASCCSGRTLRARGRVRAAAKQCSRGATPSFSRAPARGRHGTCAVSFGRSWRCRDRFLPRCCPPSMPWDRCSDCRWAGSRMIALLRTSACTVLYSRSDEGGAQLVLPTCDRPLRRRAAGNPGSTGLLTCAVWVFRSGRFFSVVDPGVGGRPAVIVEADARWYVGPGNGLFELIARRAETVRTGRSHGRLRSSASFHGRDLFAPVAAMLARGEPPPGRPCIDTDRRPGRPDDLSEIVYLDHFGNAFTGLRTAVLPAGVRLAVADQVLACARTFSDLPLRTAFGMRMRTVLPKSPSIRASGPHARSFRPDGDRIDALQQRHKAVRKKNRRDQARPANHSCRP